MMTPPGGPNMLMELLFEHLTTHYKVFVIMLCLGESGSEEIVKTLNNLNGGTYMFC